MIPERLGLRAGIVAGAVLLSLITFLTLVCGVRYGVERFQQSLSSRGTSTSTRTGDSTRF